MDATTMARVAARTNRLLGCTLAYLWARRPRQNACGLAVLAIAGALCPLQSSAALFSFSGLSSDGHPISATANFVLDPALDTVTVTLTNTTTTTFDAAELFTGLDFSLFGFIPSLTSDTGIQRTIDNAGSFVDTLAAVDLTWTLAALGSGVFQLNFNPNAEDSIIGPPTAGSYAGANGSIKGNNGHNPFAAQSAVFILNVPNLEPNTPVGVIAWRFGTNLESRPADVPEPATALLAAIGLAAAGWMRRRR